MWHYYKKYYSFYVTFSFIMPTMPYLLELIQTLNESTNKLIIYQISILDNLPVSGIKFSYHHINLQHRCPSIYTEKDYCRFPFHLRMANYKTKWWWSTKQNQYIRKERNAIIKYLGGFLSSRNYFSFSLAKTLRLYLCIISR